MYRFRHNAHQYTECDEQELKELMDQEEWFVLTILDSNDNDGD